jgi:hypothetical protein
MDGRPFARKHCSNMNSIVKSTSGSGHERIELTRTDANHCQMKQIAESFLDRLETLFGRLRSS